MFTNEQGRFIGALGATHEKLARAEQRLADYKSAVFDLVVTRDKLAHAEYDQRVLQGERTEGDEDLARITEQVRNLRHKESDCVVRLIKLGDRNEN